MCAGTECTGTSSPSKLINNYKGVGLKQKLNIIAIMEEDHSGTSPQ